MNKRGATARKKRAKRTQGFEKKNSISKSPNARKRIESAIRLIPEGKVSTYGAIAKAAGFPGKARQVVQVLHRGFDLPWQRVLGAGGEIKLRGDAAMEQRLRLEAEGVRFRGRRVDMKQCEVTSAHTGAGKKNTTKPHPKRKRSV